MAFGRYLVLLWLFALMPGNAFGQTTETIPFFSLTEASNAVIRALRALPTVKCGNELCAAATTEERASPPLSPEEARIVMLTGAKSARLKWCGLNWQDRAFSALMLRLQAQGVYDTRKLALIQLIHDTQFSKDYLGLQALKVCDEDLRASLDETNPEVKVERWRRMASNLLLDASVENILSRVLNDIHKSRCGPVRCAPATADEKANPPLTIDQARQAMRVGLFSGAAKFCALDWRRAVFFPFMAHHRSQLKMSTRQLAMISMLHGTMQGFILEKYKEHEKQCSSTMRENLEQDLSRS